MNALLFFLIGFNNHEIQDLQLQIKVLNEKINNEQKTRKEMVKEYENRISMYQKINEFKLKDNLIEMKTLINNFMGDLNDEFYFVRSKMNKHDNNCNDEKICYCNNQCQFDNDGECDDTLGLNYCDFGSDCNDCGERDDPTTYGLLPQKNDVEDIKLVSHLYHIKFFLPLLLLFTISLFMQFIYKKSVKNHENIVKP